jgi:glyoxylase-like metal-dependent hydrolase (beta-lactamase superfamily II)
VTPAPAHPVQRWQIGDVAILRVVESEIPIPPAFLFGDTKLDVLERASWLRPRFVTEDGRLVTSIHAFVVDDGRHRIVVDTCIGNDKVRRQPFWSNLHGPFLADLSAAGYPAESIDRVLCTHMHVDHVGWNTRLVDGRWVPTFPNARYLFARTEWEHWQKEPVDPGDDILGDSVRPIFDAGLADLVECDHRVSPSVRLEPTPGHTPGHVCVRIESGGARAVITGDLMHHPLQIAEPDIGALFDSDAAAARATRRDFVARQADADVLVLGTHFATPTGGRIVGRDGARSFVPDAGG